MKAESNGSSPSTGNHWNTTEYNRTRIASVHRKKASRPNLLPERLVRLDSGNDAAQIRERQQQLRILQREIQKQKPALPLW
jgi:hypothetical protein